MSDDTEWQRTADGLEWRRAGDYVEMRSSHVVTFMAGPDSPVTWHDHEGRVLATAVDWKAWRDRMAAPTVRSEPASYETLPEDEG
jgi:hypothetical protein